MACSRLAINMNSYVASRLTAAAQFTLRYSIYPSPVSISEMTSAQALIITIFHSFLYKDIETIHSLLSISKFLPQLRSSFIQVWLRDDFNFQRKDVAKVLSAVAHFIQDQGPIIPDSILFAICGLEEKYDIFNFFQQNGDEFGQQLLAYLNPLVSRGTQVEQHLLQESEEKWKAKISPNDLQRTNQQKLMQSLHFDELDLAKCPPIRPPRRNRLRRSGTLPPSSKFRHNYAERLESEEVQRNVISTPATDQPSAPTLSTAIQLRLESALETGDPSSIEQALNAGANPNLTIRSVYSSPLLYAASKGLDTVLRVLLRYGADVNACDQLGWGPLHTATYYGHLSSVQILLDAGARSRNDKISPLQIAVARNHKEIVKLLIRYISTEV
ncbi:unnamed protein product [Nezara viridula]|uniref:Uncharacterized protein n=1 Tax=Nezara viridula TaxID=85310 RepID=A0A9P0GZT8_NEZVI|nr:unnamed protein product [Nezara viridula]